MSNKRHLLVLFKATIRERAAKANYVRTTAVSAWRRQYLLTKLLV